MSYADLSHLSLRGGRLAGRFQSSSSRKTITLKGRSQAEFLEYRGSARSAALLKLRRGLAYVRPGDVFERWRKDKIHETARITGVSIDGFGIPHIRYDLTLRKPHINHTVSDADRILALRTFADTFRKSK